MTLQANGNCFDGSMTANNNNWMQKITMIYTTDEDNDNKHIDMYTHLPQTKWNAQFLQGSNDKFSEINISLTQ